MRALFERLIALLPLHARCRRALDESMADWKHEDESTDNPFLRWIWSARSAASVLRALVMVSWWSPRTPLPRPVGAAAVSARDEILGLVNGLSPESSYEDILRELAARHGTQQGNSTPASPPPSPARSSLNMRRRDWKIAAAIVVCALAGALLQSRLEPRWYESTALLRMEREPVPVETLAPGGVVAVVTPQALLETELAVLNGYDLKRRVVRKLRLDRNGEPAVAGQPSGNSGDAETSDEAAAIAVMAMNLSVSTQPQSQIIRIRYRASSAALAALIANAFADERVAQHFGQRRVSILESAQPAGASASADDRILLLWISAGMLAFAAVVLRRTRIDKRRVAVSA